MISDALNDVVQGILDKQSVDNIDMAMTFFEFADSEKWSLMPFQKFILKIFYGYDLSDTHLVDDAVNGNTIEPRDDFSENIIGSYTEVAFMDFLYKQKRINISNEMYMQYKRDDPNFRFTEIVSLIGRRGFKTTTSSYIAIYTLYLLLKIDNYSKFFNILEEDYICINLVSSLAKNVKRQYNSISNLLMKSSFFKPYIVKVLSDEGIFIATNKKRKEVLSGDAKTNYDILVQISSVFNPIRGGANIVCIMDEFDNYMDSKELLHEVGGYSNTRSALLYEALTPSTLDFVGKDGKSYGTTLIMSTPNTKKGFLYNTKVKDAFGSKDFLFLHLPSTWVNPTLDSHGLRKIFNTSVLKFKQEIMAEYVDSKGTWLKPDNQFYSLFTTSITGTDLTYYNPQHKYFAGLDFGLSNDGTAIVIAHKELVRSGFEYLEEDMLQYHSNKEVIVVDYFKYWLPENGEVLDIDFVLGEITTILRHYRVSKGIYDQWSGAILGSQFKKFKIHCLEQYNSTKTRNHKIWELFAQLKNEGRLILPYNDTLINDLLGLTEIIERGYIKIENTFYHDDLSDALVRAIKLAFDSSVYPIKVNSSVKSTGTKGLVGRATQLSSAAYNKHSRRKF